MKVTSLILSMTMLILLSCSKEPGESKSTKLSDQFINGELALVAKERGLTPDDLIAATKTYNPTGALDEYLAFFGTGVSGRVAVVGMPSMKILKYVAVFSAEPWQGFAFDDESKAVVDASSRDEVSYTYGDIGAPALSLTNGEHDGRALFLSDAANGRIGLLDLAEYETKQVVSNPLFRNSNPDLAVSSDTSYVVQTTASPEVLPEINGKSVGGATFWKFIEKESEGHKIFFIDPATSFSVLLPATPLSSPVIGKNVSEGMVLTVSRGETPFLNVINLKLAENQVATKSVKLKNHFSFNEETALKLGILKRLELPAGTDNVILSGDGKYAVLTNRTNPEVTLLETKDILADSLKGSKINVGGASVDAAFTGKNLYVTVHNPHQVVKVALADKSVKTKHALDFSVGKIFIPQGDSNKSEDKYAVVTNHTPYGRFTRVGPQLGLSAHLLDLTGEKIRSLYDASIPQSTRLSAVAMSSKINKPVFKYKIGTDPRSGKISSYKTGAGQEKIIRNGKRVHVYATVIRSHITPDYVEVEQGDTVTFHITSNEQSRDQTHGFTIDSYNVNGSWEPGKTASVTFLADRAGVFPFYCTEFCSALHLEMQGYLLVKPSTQKAGPTTELVKLQNNHQMKSFFKYIKGE